MCEIMEKIRSEAKAEGWAEGRAEGQACLNKLYAILIEMGRYDDLKRSTKDMNYQAQLLHELLPEEMA